MNKKKSEAQRERTALIIPREKFRSLLFEQISKGRALLSEEIQTEEQLKQKEKDFATWSAYNYELLKNSFNKTVNEYRSGYNSAGQMIGVADVMHGANINNPNYRYNVLKQRIETKIDGLERILAKSELMLSEADTTPLLMGQRTDETMTLSDVVFIIHGHDEEMKRNVQLFINRADLRDVVLHEQPDKNRTVIEKLIEEGAKASYVIALLSPDDLQNDGTNRARQNVILEIGYFLGKLGRERVRLLKKGDTIIPSDLQGILYDTYDREGAWRIKLAKEIQAVGISINIDRIIAKF